MIKVLNLYAGIGGNRKLWENVEVTAVENNEKIAEVYQTLYPNDKVVVDDAHNYLLDHSHEYDFIWSSPPCPTHSITNYFLNPQGLKRYPDLKLYQEIIYLTHFFKGKYCVENVKSYYNPLIKPQIAGRHYFWANYHILNFLDDEYYDIGNIANARTSTRKDPINYLKSLENYHGIDLSNFKVPNKRLLLRNCVKPSLGLHIFNCAYKTKQEVLNNGTL